MDKKFTLILINHSFQINYFSRRWELFAQRHPNVDVYLLAPSHYAWYTGKNHYFGENAAKIIDSFDFDKDNYHRRTYRMKNSKLLGFSSPDFKILIKEINPDVIYNIGTHNMRSLYQLLKIRDKYKIRSKIIAFSMRGPAMSLKLNLRKCSVKQKVARIISYNISKYYQNYIYDRIDAFFCHYPDAIDCFRKEGYNGPIYMQTQVGVNEEWFHEDEKARIDIRRKFAISESTFVFGSATRFSIDKGVDIILKALPEYGDWKYLMMGSGTDEEKERLHKIIKSRHLEDRVIETGMVDWYDIAKYWNAIDCAIHVPLTTPYWEETFSLSVVQPQITKKPIIGSTSGSVPYQIGYKEMIVPEGDISALHEIILWTMSHKEEVKIIGREMYERTHNSFEIHHLNDMFYDTLVEDILPCKYDIRKLDMVGYKPKDTLY